MKIINRYYSKEIINTVIIHTLAVVFYIFWELSITFFSESNIPLWVYLIYYVLDVVYIYCGSLIFLPFIERVFKGNIKLIFSSIIIVIAYTCSTLLVGTFLTFLYNGKVNFNYSNELVVTTFRRGLFFFFLAFGYWNGRHRIEKIKAIKEKEIQLAQSREREALMENALLRAQINSHFLFNALNGIYIRMLKKVPEDAGIVLMLAEMMDYSLVNTKEKAITTIGEELQQLNRLFKLYQFLNNDSLQILYDFDASEQAKDAPIIPLLFFNLTENIFKHGKLDDPHQPALVKLVSHNNGIEFTSSNFKSNSARGASRNIGLSNTRNRLQLHYPDNHELSILETEDRFEVRLIISL